MLRIRVTVRAEDIKEAANLISRAAQQMSNMGGDVRECVVRAGTDNKIVGSWELEEVDADHEDDEEEDY